MAAFIKGLQNINLQLIVLTPDNKLRNSIIFCMFLDESVKQTSLNSAKLITIICTQHKTV